MNKTYRIVWNETTNTWVAVAEIAKAHGKSASVGGGIVASCTQVGARFAFTAAASAVLMMGAPAMAANGTEYQSGTDNLCYYDTTSQSVVCGSNATNTADTSGGKPAKSVVMGLDSTNTGESNVTIGNGAITTAEHSLKVTKVTNSAGVVTSTKTEFMDISTPDSITTTTDASGNTTTVEVLKNQPSAAIAIGQMAKSTGGYGVALGYQAHAARTWDISIGRLAGAGQTTTQTEGRNIAIGDGALRGANNPNNNIAMGTDAGRNTAGAGNVIIGTYANSPTANGAAITANNVVAVGERAVASSGSAVAVGTRSKSSGAITVAVGASANASGNYAIAQGFAAQATGISSVAIGSAQNLPNQTRATAHYGTAIGFAANAGAEGAIAIGRHANHDISSSATDSTGRAKTTGANSIAIGTDTNAAGQSSNAIGNTATATGKDSASFGSKATATHESALAVGSAAQAINTNAVAVGGGAVASAVGASALGRGANATGTNAVSVGIDSLADKDNAVAIGVNSKAQNNSNIAVGNLATATGATSAIAVGRQSVASGTSSIATGYKSAASTENSIAIGNAATANGGTGAIAVGKATIATGQSAVVMGTDSSGTAQSVVVIGNASKATADNAVAIGIKANATGTGNVAIGENAGEAHSSNLQGSNTVLIGVKAGSQSTNNQAQVAVGWQAGQGTLGAYNVASGYQAGQFVNGENNVAFGKGAGSGTSATARLDIDDTVAIGTGAKATANNGIAIGKGAQANAINTISIGTGNIVNGAGSGAIGDPSTVNGTGSYSLGNDNTITTNDTFVIGNDVTQTLENSVILGDSSSASGINTGTYTLDGTQDSKVKGVTDVVGVVSVGTAGQTRQIQNVAAGVVSDTSTDAINGSQLYAVAKELKDGQTHYYSVNSTKTATGDNYNNEGATGQNALAAGVTTSATGIDAVAIGSTATASGNQSLAVGNNIEATHLGATAVGNNSRALADGAQAFGQSSQATAKDSAAMGRYARATAERATAVGIGNLASGTSSFAGGDKSTAAGAQSIAIGLSANSAASNTIAMGNSAQATQEGAIAIGTSTVSGSTNSVVLGTKATVAREDSTSNVIIGHEAQAIASTTSTTDLGKDAVAIGFKSQVGAASNVAIGSNAKAIGNSQATAVGYNTDAKGYQSAAFGSGAKTSDNAGSSLALGKDASATIANGVALGSGSVANVTFGATGADPLNAATDKTTSTWKASHAAVSVGNGTTVTRQITSVAAGTQDTDAVNVAQLKAAGFTLATSASAGVQEDKTAATATGADDKKIQNGETVTVDAGKNIKVTQTGQTVSIATKDDVAFTTVTTTDAAGNKTVLNGTGMTITPTGGANPVSLTSAGLNNGGNKITNVADGDIASGSKEAVNGGQVFDLKQELTANSGNISKGLDFAGNTGDFNRQLGEKTTISGGLTDSNKSSSNSNIRTVASNGTIDIQLADAPVFTGKVSAQGLDAGGQKITGVQDGQSTTDAVNVGQLQTAIANVANTTQTVVNQNSPFSYIGTVNGAKVALLRSVDSNGDAHFVLADGSNTPYTGDVTISALNPKEPQLSVPTTVGNIADGKANNDAVNVSQLKNAVTALGGGAVVNADGSITKPTYTVVNNTFDNVGGAIDALNTEVQKPLTFAGDSGVNVERKLGTTVNVVGGVTDTTKLTDDNIGIVADGTDTLTVKLAKNIDLGVDGSVTTGDTKVDNAGVTITSTSTGKTPVSLTNAGLDNGGNVISNVGAGKANTDAVNVSQLTPLATALGVNVDPNSGIVAAPSFVVTKTDGSTYAGATTIQGALNNIGTEIQKGITFTGNNGQAVKKLGETFNIKGTLDSAATASDKNIRTEVDGNGVMSIKLAESPKFGNVTINDAGKITGVTAGTADTDAVNVAQLNDKTATTPLTVGNTGVVDTPADTSKLATAGDIANAINKAGFTLTTAKTSDGELGATATNELINAGDTVTVEADKNIKVTQTNGKISIATKDDVSFNSVTAGSGANAVVLDNKGVNVGGKTYISDAGLNANDKKITNVANGDITSASKDAINGSQLRNTADDIASIIGGDAGVDDAGNVTASNIGGTGAKTIDDAIKTVKTTVKSTDNTIKVTANPADATNGTVFDISVDAQKLAESAQLPVVYTDADGNKVYKVNGKFTKDPTGQDATQEVAATNVIASMQNADGTISPTTLANIKAGTQDTDAVNVSQLQGAVDALGGGATINADGTIKAPTYNITNPANGTVTTANNVGDALKGLNDAVNSPLTFKGDSGEFNRNLGQTTTVKGGITDTAKLSDNNIGVVAKDGTLDIKLAKDIAVDSVKAGDTTVNTYGVSIANADPNKVVSLTASGLNNGNNRITNVAAGQAGTDAVNKDQLDKAKAAATTKVVEGKNVKVTEQPNADGSKTYTVATKDDVNFNSVTAGTGANQVVLNNDGVKVGGNTYISDAGLNANNKKVSNVANGDVSATSKDSINGSQLYGTANSVATALGGGATVQADGKVSAPTYNITNPADGTVTKANNVGDALKGLNDAVNSPLIFAGDSGKNVERKLGTTLGIKGGVTDAAKLSQNNIGVVSNGTDTLEIQLAKELTGLTSVSTGNTVMNNDGVIITGTGGAKPVSLTNAGLDNGGNKITNVAAGTDATDAVNKDQLDKAQAAASNKVKAGDNIEVAESKNADGSTTYTVATAKDVNFNSVTAGSGANQVVLGDDGVKVGGNTYISNAGLNANDKKITNVAAGTVAKDSKDAINGSQLFAQGEGVKNIIGGTTTYDPATGTYTNSNIGGTGKGNINDAIQAINTAATQAKSTVTAGDNIVVTPSQNADGSTNYTVATAKDLTVDSIKAGDTTINNAGVTVGDKVALTNTGLTAGDVKVSTDGINAGNKVITGVASGLNGKTLDQIKADPNAAERTNAASIGDLAEVQSNVTNITNNVTNITNNVLNGNTKDANGNTVTYVDDSGNLTDAGKVALTTYNVSGQTEFVHNSVISAIQQMNNEGIKYFHTNDGQTPVAENTNSQDSSASGKYASAVGYQTSSSGENATAVGSSLTVTTDSQTAGATVTEVTENGQIVLKQRTTASGARAVALGAGSQALGADSIAIGTGNVVSGKGSGAIGDPTVVTGDSAYSIGNNNTVSANNAYALGSNITANVADSVYLGDRTTTSGVHIANPANGSTYTYGGLNDANVAGVTGSTAPANNVVGVVAVGNNADEVRQIQGVAAGVVSPTSTDAINGSQLYDTHQAIGNVANYTVNMGNQLNQRIDGVEKRSNAGTAAAMAVAGLPQAYLPGKSMMAVSGSTYRGESGYAVGFSSISDNGNWIIKGSATGNSRGHYGATAGVGYQW